MISDLDRIHALESFVLAAHVEHVATFARTIDEITNFGSENKM